MEDEVSGTDKDKVSSNKDVNITLLSLRHLSAIEDVNKGNNKITELRTILQRESPNS
jgi:hypothetical protein